MKLFLDSDILLDVLLGREPYVADSANVLDWAEQHPGSCAVSWHSLANIHYLSKDGARDFIRELLVFCVIPSVGTDQFDQALEMPFSDLEDAMQVSSAIVFGAQIICTRNLDDYKASVIPTLSPGKLIQKLSS